MKKTIFISLLLATFALAAEPATAVKTTTPTNAATVKNEPVKAAPATDSKAQAVTAPAKENVVADTSAKAEATPAKALPAADSNAQAATAPAKENVVADTSAKAEVTPAKAEPAVSATEKTAATPTKNKKKVKKTKKVKAKKAPLITAGAFKFDMNSDFEIQAGKVLWASEDDKNKYNMEEWFGRANLAFFTQSENFDGKVSMSVYPGDLIDKKTVVANSDTTPKETEMREVIELNEAWAWQRTKYLNFKLGRWENTDKNGDYFGGYVDGYLNGFKSTFDPENMIQFGFTPTENLSVDLALISTGPYLNTGDLRIVAHFSQLSSIEALNIDLALRTNIFDKVYDHESDVRTNISVKVNIPLLEDKLFLFGEVAMLGLGGDSTELYIDNNGIVKERDVVVDWKMPITGGLMLKNTVVDRIILEAEYIADRSESEYHSNSKHIKDVLGAFYIEKDLTSRFTLSAGVHNHGSSKDWVINGNLIGRIN